MKAKDCVKVFKRRYAKGEYVVTLQVGVQQFIMFADLTMIEEEAEHLASMLVTALTKFGEDYAKDQSQ